MAIFFILLSVCVSVQIAFGQVLLETPSTLIIGQESLEIRCLPSAGAGTWTIDNILLFGNKSDALGSAGSRLLSIYYDRNEQKDVLNWLDTDLQTRATAFGNIDTPINANLTLIIPSSATTCSDASAYRCQISGTEFGLPVGGVSTDAFITPLAYPDQMDNITETITDGYKGENHGFDYGTSLELLCNATLGIPQRTMQWCIRKGNETSFVKYPDQNDVTDDTPAQEGRCQNRQKSRLVYNITEKDENTVILCEVTNATVCGDGLINRTYPANVVYGRVAITAPSSVTLPTDPLEVTCAQLTSGEGLIRVHRIVLMKSDQNGNYSQIVSAVYNATSNQSEVEWTDAGFRNRSTATGNVSSIAYAKLVLSISSENITCSDEGRYKCLLEATNVKEETITHVSETYIQTIVLPDSIDTLEVRQSDGQKLVSATVDLGMTLQFMCNGTVGNPPHNISWCVKRSSDVNFTDFSDVTVADAVLLDDCQYGQNSSFTYNVTTSDPYTTFLCEIGRQGNSCGSGSINASYTINAVDVDATISSPTLVTSQQENLTISCRQSASGLGIFSEIVIAIYRNETFSSLFDKQSHIVSIRRNFSSPESDAIWENDEVRLRSTVRGNLSHPSSSYIELTFSGNDITCLDEGWYGCEVNLKDELGTLVSRQDSKYSQIEVLPGNVEVTVPSSSVLTEGGAFEPGTVLNIVCNGTTGYPPKNITWCFKRKNESEFSIYHPIANESGSKEGSCQFRRVSNILYEVTDIDIQTTMVCTIGENSSCGPHYINASFTIFTMDFDVMTSQSEIIRLGYEELYIQCSQSGSNNGLKHVSGITLSRQSGNKTSPLVSLRRTDSNSSNWIWYNPLLQIRAIVDGDLGTYPAYLNLTINKFQALCEDGGIYICTMEAMDIGNLVVKKQQNTTIVITTNPDAIQQLVATSDTGEHQEFGVYSPGTELSINCNSTVGDPPQNVTWCIKTADEGGFTEYLHTSDIVYSQAVRSESCQYWLESVLSYNVTSNDSSTILLCQAGNNVTCGNSTTSASFNLYTYDFDVSISQSDSIKLGEQELYIECNQTGTNNGLQFISALHLSQERANTSVPLVSLKRDANTSTIEWHDVGLKSRARVQGDITVSQAYLRMVINASSVLCEDKGKYFCEIEAVDIINGTVFREKNASVLMEANPSDMQDIVAAHEGTKIVETGSFPPGIQISLTCNSTVGDPPQNVSWCIKMQNETEFSEYRRTGDITWSKLVRDGTCQFRSTSVLMYNVTSRDKETTILCQAGDNNTCGNSTVQKSFNLYAVSVTAKVDIVAPSTLIPGSSELEIVCSLTGSDEGIDHVSRIALYKDTGGSNFSQLVSVLYNKTTGSVTYSWHDEALKQRMVVYSNMSLLPVAYFEIEANMTTCEDAAKYRCEVTIVDVSSRGLVFIDDAAVDIRNIPDNVEDIVGRTNTTTRTGLGAFPVNSVVELTCNATVGLPPYELMWCKMERNSSNYTPLQNYTLSAPIQSSACQNRQLSTLLYNVSLDDIETRIACGARSNMSCDMDFGNSTFVLYSIYTGVDILATPGVVNMRNDSLHVTCIETGFRTNLYRQSMRMFIFKDTRGSLGTTESLVVSVKYDLLSRSSIVTWHDFDVRDRAAALGDISLGITVPSTLTLSIAANSTTCEDGAWYRCKLNVTDASSRLIQENADTFVDKKYIADRIEEIKGSTESKVSIAQGVFESGNEVLLACNASVGYPPLNISWCVKYPNNTDYSPYFDASRVNQSDVFGSCTGYMMSYLTYNVAVTDTEISFQCQVGGQSDCFFPILSRTFTLYTVDAGIQIKAPDRFTLGEEALDVLCQTTGSTRAVYRLFSTIELVKTDGTSNRSLVSVQYDLSSRSSVIHWKDLQLKDRASVTGVINIDGVSDLHLLISANQTACEDAANYTCVLTERDFADAELVFKDGQPVEVEVLPENLGNIQVFTKDGLPLLQRSFEIGAQLLISCSGLVGIPAYQLNWCFKRKNDSAFKHISNLDAIEQSDPSPDGACQSYRTSDLKLNITSADEQTELLCETRNATSACETGLQRSAVTLYAIDVEFRIHTAAVNATVGYDGINITCSQNKLGIGLKSINKIQLYKDTGGILGTESSKVVSVEIGNFIIWQDTSVQSRATVYGDISTAQGAYLRLSIDRGAVTCDDGAVYRCELFGIDASNQVFIQNDDETIEMFSVPETPIIEMRKEDGTLISSNQVSVGTKVKITCSGKVGKPERLIDWCILTSNTSTFAPYPFPDNITSSPPTLVPGESCKYQSSSLLDMIIPNDYLNLQVTLMCEIGRSTCGTGESNSSIVFNVVDVETSTLAPVAQLSDSSGLSGGALAGIVICVLAAVCLPVIAMMVWKRHDVINFVRKKIGEPEYRVQPEKIDPEEIPNVIEQSTAPMDTSSTNGIPRLKTGLEKIN